MNSFLRNTVLGTVASLLISGFCLAEERTVRIYNWIEYLPPEVLKSFQEETGIRPIYDVFDSAETMESKLLTGNSGYDVVFPGTANLGHLITAGAVQPLDRAQLPNWQHLDPEFMKSLEAVGDTGNRYAVPYLWGTTLIGYNVDKVRKALGPDVQMNSWDIIFKEENLAKLASCGVGFLDAGNEILPIALHYKGLDPNSQKREDYVQAQAVMMKIRPYVTYFNSSRYGMDLANGDICVGVGWSGGVALAARLADAAGKGVKVEIAEETATIDVAVIVKYGFKIHEVCQNIQRKVKTTIETMTGLNVAAVNVAVQSISFDKGESKAADAVAEEEQPEA